VPPLHQRWYGPVYLVSKRLVGLTQDQVNDSVTGAPYREVNSKVATAPKLKVKDKDTVNNSRRIKAVKLNIVKLKASLNKFPRGKLVIEVECQTLKLK